MSTIPLRPRQRAFPLILSALICLRLLVGNPALATVSVHPYGDCAEGPVSLYTLINKNGWRVSIMDYGATVVNIFTPNRKGHFDDIVLGFDKPETYASAKLNFGTMGRYINRIGGGQFTLDGQTFHLTKNSGPNTMHGGKLGFNRRLWKAEIISQEISSVSFKRLSVDGEEGFPGNLQTQVTFTLTDDNILKVEYRASTDKPTVVNLSNHTLFNLSGPGNGTIMDDVVMINADAVTPVDATSVPTGEIRKVEGTPWDLRKPLPVKTHMREFTNNPPGYDINYVLNKPADPGLFEAGEIYDPASGRDVKVYTDQPGAQFYTGNMFDGTLIGKGDVPYTTYCGLSIEAQCFPDSPNHREFPSAVLRPGDVYSKTIEYRFNVRQQ